MASIRARTDNGLLFFDFRFNGVRCREQTALEDTKAILRHLGLALRNPYQTRHTAATLWLTSGEAPEWIARQLGHSNTEMLFRVYSRYVPNLTRRDGSAFERLLLQSGAASSDPVDGDVASPEASKKAPGANIQETGVSHG